MFFLVISQAHLPPIAPNSASEREREGMNSFLLPPPFPGLFYDVCQRQHRLQKVFRAGPKLSEVQQPSGKRSGHCGWSGRRMMPSPPTFHLQLVSFSCPPFSLACSLFAFGFRLSTPCTSAGCEQDSSIRVEQFAHTIYIHIYMCIYIHVCPPTPSVTSRSSSYRNFCASKNNNRLVLCSHSGGAPVPPFPILL